MSRRANTQVALRERTALVPFPHILRLTAYPRKKIAFWRPSSAKSDRMRETPLCKPQQSAGLSKET